MTFLVLSVVTPANPLGCHARESGHPVTPGVAIAAAACLYSSPMVTGSSAFADDDNRGSLKLAPPEPDRTSWHQGSHVQTIATAMQSA
jgi:hypothetical protein